jgi:hypothetical protein
MLAFCLSHNGEMYSNYPHRDLCSKIQGLYSQHFTFFVTDESAQ